MWVRRLCAVVVGAVLVAVVCSGAWADGWTAGQQATDQYGGWGWVGAGEQEVHSLVCGLRFVAALLGVVSFGVGVVAGASLVGD